MYILNSIPEAVQRINFTAFKQEAAKSQLLHHQILNMTTITPVTSNETEAVHQQNGLGQPFGVSGSVVELMKKSNVKPHLNPVVEEVKPTESENVTVTMTTAESVPSTTTQAVVATTEPQPSAPRLFSPKHSIEEINGRLGDILARNAALRLPKPSQH